MASNEYLRAGSGIVVVDPRGRVLGLERCDVPGSWQFPQGGLDPGEDPLDAARRELEEETGIDWRSVELLAEYPTWLGYELPPDARRKKTGRGQVHRWFLVRFTGDDSEIDVRADDEFCDWCWMEFDELVNLTWPIRRPVYEALRSAWSEFLT
jgi:putative (di)nucleoside polyphosphate hydrolase